MKGTKTVIGMLNKVLTNELTRDRIAHQQQLEKLRTLQALRAPLPLVDGLGRNWGLWTIQSISEKQASVIDDGTAMVINWTLLLEEFVNA